MAPYHRPLAIWEHRRGSEIRVQYQARCTHGKAPYHLGRDWIVASLALPFKFA